MLYFYSTSTAIKITTLRIMKHLKPFNESVDNKFTQEELDDIKDIFQDLIDEHNMEKHSFDVMDCGIAYSIDKSHVRMVSIRIFTPTVNGEVSPWVNEEEILNSIDEFIERLRLMKYLVERDEFFLSQRLDYIKIDIRKNFEKVKAN